LSSVSSILALQRPVRRQLDLVQDRLKGLFRTPIPILNQVGGHVLATRGKKFRPTLLLLTAKLRGHLGEDAVVCATVVELVHAAALIHDDSVDRSQLRRGMPTVNELWTDEMAIIMGDYLYAQSMALLVDNGHTTAMSIMARVVSEMSCGEALEFQYAFDLEVTEAQYEDLIRAKTGSLIGAATEIGAGLNGGARDVTRRDRYRKFGEKMGVAFQIVDDLFDYLSDSGVTGKPVGYDLAEGKVTLPLIAALREAGEADRRKLRRLAHRKRWTPGQWWELHGLIERNGGFAYSRTRAGALADEARARLDDAGDPAVGGNAAARATRKALDRAIDYAVRRDR
jgi:octaprenyl-diphosphate synthase